MFFRDIVRRIRREIPSMPCVQKNSDIILAHHHWFHSSARIWELRHRALVPVVFLALLKEERTGSNQCTEPMRSKAPGHSNFVGNRTSPEAQPSTLISRRNQARYARASNPDSIILRKLQGITRLP